jgi:hypothetical protein
MDDTEYDKALDFAFNEGSRIYNIAITGPYGAGKSSVFDSYLKKRGRSDNDMIRISLVKSHLDENTDDKPETKPLLKGNLEAEIISQLVAQLDPNKIPSSGFKRIDALSGSKRKCALICTGFLLAAVAILIFLSLETFCEVSPLAWTGSLAVVILLCTLLLYRAVKVLVNKSTLMKLLKRIKLFNAEIELFEAGGTSINKYLDEVLYMLKASEKDIVVFEDLDRYNNPNIYSTLRNLCFLLNEQFRLQAESGKESGARRRMEVTGRRVVRFVYMTRDDLFSQGDRTKYFDFIIPIVPVLDGSNTTS